MKIEKKLYIIVEVGLQDVILGYLMKKQKKQASSIIIRSDFLAKVSIEQPLQYLKGRIHIII
jgi:hypothetical protein